MNFKKKVNGSWVDTPYYLKGTDTETITTLPATIYPLAQTATIGLKGNTVQNGTPTPDSPIMPQGTGEKTGNLFDDFDIVGQVPSVTNGELTNSISGGTTSFIPLSNPLVSLTLFSSTMQTYLFLYDENKTFIGQATLTSVRTVSSSVITGYANAKYARIRSDKISLYDKNVTLVYGSTAPSEYIPYGYKIPISSANTTTPVYLGEVETTRKIKKLVLDGTENWVLEYTDNFLLNTTIDNAQPFQLVVCTHQQSISTGYESNTNFENVRISQTKKLNFRTRTIPHNLSDFKSYLQQQYAAGTPVTVWYVLATETTGIVNEPLMKIGEYADEVSGITIPTIAGANTISVGTTLQPSEVTVNYKGWHPVQSVHERNNGAWT